MKIERNKHIHLFMGNPRLDCFSRKSQFHHATYLLCAVLLAGCVATNQPSIKDQGKKTAPIPQVPASTVLSVEDMQEDLAYTGRILKEVHPMIYHGLSGEQQVIIQSSYETARTPMTAQEFYFVLNSVICSEHNNFFASKRFSSCTGSPLPYNIFSLIMDYRR